jgi:hypothetical protein
MTTLPDEAKVNAAHELEQQIIACARGVALSTWGLAESLYRFHESAAWGLLGYESLGEFLAQPELGMSRTHFFRLTKLWRDLVVVREIEPAKLLQIEPMKLNEVVPAIMRGQVSVDDALSDAQALGARDLRKKYGNQDQADQTPGLQRREGAPSDLDDEPLEATREPVLVQCDLCRSWVPPERLTGDPHVREDHS